MSIQRMREWVKSHRILIGVLFGLLVLSLLLTYSIGNLGRSSAGSDEVDYSAFEESIANQRAEQEANPDDYATNYNLANSLYEYANQLYQSENEEDYQKGMDALAEAAPLYVRAAENAGEDVNDLAKAQMYTRAAQCYASVDESAQAEEYYLLALDLAPDDLDTVIAYAQYLAYAARYDESINLLNELSATIDDEATKSSVDSLIQQLETLRDSAESTDEQETQEESSTETTESEQ